MVKRVIKPGRERIQSMVNALTSQTVKVGYFADQGMHSSAKMSYPALMYLQEVTGVRSRNGRVHRRLFELTVMTDGKQVRLSTLTTLKRQFARGNAQAVMDHFGKEMVKSIRDNFGKITALTPQNSPDTIARKGNNLPLIETSELMAKLTYRITKKGS